MNDILWNKISLAEFRSLACLTEEEDKVLEDWAYGRSVVSTSMRCNMSTRQVNRVRDQIRAKYDDVQIYTPLLQQRVVT